jgi:hypothetical protein
VALDSRRTWVKPGDLKYGRQWLGTLQTKFLLTQQNLLPRKLRRTSEKNSRRQSKYSQKSDNSVVARKAYSQHDNLIEPDDTADISSEQLEEAKTRFYTTQVKLKELQILSVKHDSKVDSLYGWIHSMEGRENEENNCIQHWYHNYRR